MLLLIMLYPLLVLLVCILAFVEILIKELLGVGEQIDIGTIKASKCTAKQNPRCK